MESKDIKSMSDVYECLGINPPRKRNAIVAFFRKLFGFEQIDRNKELNDKMSLTAKALNGGWNPEFDNKNEYYKSDEWNKVGREQSLAQYQFYFKSKELAEQAVKIISESDKELFN